MSKDTDKIVNEANVTLSTDAPITDKEKILQVILASKLSKTTLSPLRLKQLRKRYIGNNPDAKVKETLSDEDMNELHNKAELAHLHIINDRKLQKEKICGALGNKYPYELYLIGINDDGEETILDIDHPKVAAYIHENLHTVSFNDTLYIYNNGVYREDAHDVSAIVIDILHDKKLRQGETTAVNNIVLCLKGINKYAADNYPFDNDNGVILASNCAIKIIDGKPTETKYSHEYLKTYKLPIDYDKTAPTEPILSLFGQWVYEDDVEILIQIIAQGLHQHMKRATLKKNYMIHGDHDAAKSTYLDLLKSFVGLQDTADVSLDDICEGVRFLNSTLEGRILNIHDDQGDIKLEGSGNFKNLTGSTSFQIERKGKDVYNGYITCPHVFSCNKPPHYDAKFETDDAWWSRWEFVSFPNQFDRDTTFVGRVITSQFMSGLLNLVLSRLINMSAVNSLTVNHSVDEIRERWGMMSNPLLAWLNEEFIKSKDYWEYDTTKMFNKYTAHVETNNVPVLKRITTKENFGRKLKNMADFMNELSTVKGKVNKKDRDHVYKGKWLYMGDMKDVLTEAQLKEMMKSTTTSKPATVGGNLSTYKI